VIGLSIGVYDLFLVTNITRHLLRDGLSQNSAIAGRVLLGRPSSVCCVALLLAYACIIENEACAA